MHPDISWPRILVLPRSSPFQETAHHSISRARSSHNLSKWPVSAMLTGNILGFTRLKLRQGGASGQGFAFLRERHVKYREVTLKTSRTSCRRPSYSLEAKRNDSTIPTLNVILPGISMSKRLKFVT